MNNFIEELDKTCREVAGMPLKNIYPNMLSLVLLVHKGLATKEEVMAIRDFFNSGEAQGK